MSGGYATTLPSVSASRARQASLAALAALTASGAGLAAATAATVPVHVQGHPAVTASVRVSFHAQPLAAGGYYYAVVVLEPYRHYTRSSPPPCATSSNMQRTDYGYPRAGGEVALALTPARSAARRWCRGGTYAGAVYAVPHAPPCEGRYPCRAEPYEPPSPCWGIDGHIVCGVVALPRQYRYPDGLPAPLAKGTRVIAHFSVRFPR